jgi:hypothetical protein
MKNGFAGLILLTLAVWAAIQFWPLLVAAIAVLLVVIVVIFILKERYFASDTFLKVKEEIASVVEEHNEVSEYVQEIRDRRRFTVGRSTTGIHSHLAESTNTSSWGYKRDRNVAEYASEFVHNAGLQVVRNAKADPIKYLMKYFDIPATEEKLGEVEELGESVSRLESAVQNLKRREKAIETLAAPPGYITRFFLREFQEKIGLSIPTLEIPYPMYKFQYVSAGGNSSQETKIRLDSETIDSLIETMSEKIKFKKSAAGQRSLMTAKFRDFIKTRDQFTCKYCSVSISKEPNLLLEVDHIKPVSKGGLSVETNLQTLCWKCNRTKSNKE